MGVGDRRGVSPVIATIIIVAIAIVMSLAVAYWMLGLGGAFTRFERLEFQSAYVYTDTTYFNITVKLKNTGSADATLDMIILNGKPFDAYWNEGGNVTIYNLSQQWSDVDENNMLGNNSINNLNNVTIKPGYDFTLGIQLVKGSSWKSGMTVEIMIQTTSGRQYPKSIMLP
ncbi:MAG: archaellin/type IV pilin N-terminal domain-containing protein [Candidatus Bathyarchaeia archaeon]